MRQTAAIIACSDAAGWIGTSVVLLGFLAFMAWLLWLVQR